MRYYLSQLCVDAYMLMAEIKPGSRRVFNCCNSKEWIFFFLLPFGITQCLKIILSSAINSFCHDLRIQLCMQSCCGYYVSLSTEDIVLS